MTEISDGLPAEHASIVRLLWETREPPSRGPKPQLNTTLIARAAVAIADADGLAAVSMHRVAADLGFTKMALYRHITGKAELIAVMIEAAAGDPPDLTAVPGGWRPGLAEWARLLRVTWQRHPWLPRVTTGDRIMGPREIGWTECAVGALTGTGLDAGAQLDAISLLSGHIRNSEAGTAGTQPWHSGHQAGPTVTDLMRAYGDRFPALAAVTATATGSRRDAGWEFGLRCILDGIELLIAGRPSPL